MSPIEIFRLFGTISINKAKALADMNTVDARGRKMGKAFFGPSGIFKKIAKAAKIAFAIVAVAAGAIFVGAIKKAAEFELAMAKVNAISGATAEEFEALTVKAKELGLETAQTMTEIAAGMEALARAGFEADEIISAMGGVVALAESQTMALGEAARITATTIRQMGLEATDADRVVNLLAATAASSNTTVESLAQSMKFFAPIAHAMGMSVEETVAAVGKLGDAGLTGGIATRALQTSLQGLAKPTAEAAEMMDKLGISMFDTEGNFVGLEGAMAQIEVAFADLTQQQQLEAMATIFGTGAVKQFANLLGVGSEELARYTAEVTGTTKAFDQQATMLDTLSGQWQILKGSAELLLVTIGTDMMPILKDFLKNTIIPMVNGWTQWIEKMGGIRGMVGHALVAIGQYIQGVAEWILSHEYLAAGLDALWLAFQGLLSFVKNVFRGEWGAAWEDIKTIALNAFTAIVKLAQAAWEALPIPDSIKKKIEKTAKAIYKAIVDTFGWIIDHKDEVIAGIAAIGTGFMVLKVPAIVASLASITAGLKAMWVAAGLALGPAGWIALLITGMAYLAFRTIQEWEEIKEAGVGQWAGIIGLPTDAQWAEWARQLWQGFFGMIPTDAQWASWGRSFLVGMLEAVGAITMGILDGIAGIPLLIYDTLFGWLPKRVKDWFGIGEEIGAAIPEGIVKGIEEKEPEVVQAMEGLADVTKEAFIEMLDIRSPSGVFEGYGEDVGEGFVIGLLEKGRDIEAAGLKIIADLEREAAERAAEAGEETGDAYVDGVVDGIEGRETDLDYAVASVVKTLVDGVKDLREKLDELETSLAGAESGSYAYAGALQLLGGFHDDLVSSAEYLEENNIAVADSLTVLIAETEQYKDMTAENAEAARKAAEKIAKAEKLKTEQREAAKKAAEELHLAEHGLWEETQELIQAYDESIDGGQRQADTLSRLQGIYEETAARIELLGDEGIEASGDLLLILAALKKVGIEGEKEVTRFVQVMRDTYEGLVDIVSSAFGEMLQGAFDYFRDKERAAEEHADRMLGIEEDYAENSRDLATDYGEDKASAKLAYDRKMEDLARDHVRNLADAEDYDERIAAENRYQERVEDATIDYNRRLEDLEKNYSDASVQLAEDRKQAKDKELQAFEDSKKSWFQVMGELLSASLAAAKEEMWITAAVQGAKALMYGAIVALGGLWAIPAMLQHEAAAAVAFGLAGALTIGGAFAGFKKGAVFDSPTMLPAHMVAEGGASEAYLPLTDNVLGRIGQGIVDAIAPQPAYALAGAGGDSIQVDMRGLYDGATINVRDDQDIIDIATETHDLWQTRMRGMGREV